MRDDLGVDMRIIGENGKALVDTAQNIELDIGGSLEAASVTSLGFAVARFGAVKLDLVSWKNARDANGPGKGSAPLSPTSH